MFHTLAPRTLFVGPTPMEIRQVMIPEYRRVLAPPPKEDHNITTSPKDKIAAAVGLRKKGLYRSPFNKCPNCEAWGPYAKRPLGVIWCWECGWKAHNFPADL